MVGLDLDQSFHGPLMAEPSTAATDLLSLLRLPPASFPAEAPPGMLRDLFQTVPQNCGIFYGAEEREMGVGEDVFRHDDGGIFEDGVFEFRKEGRGKGKGSFPTEKQRRAQINEKYDILKLLVPNPTKVLSLPPPPPFPAVSFTHVFAFLLLRRTEHRWSATRSTTSTS